MYPTKEEILAKPRPTYPDGLLKNISEWKKKCYPRWTKRKDQHYCMQALARIIVDAYTAEAVYIKEGFPSRYTIKDGFAFIFIENGSIITLLHELGHHLFGPDELQACRWSVWLYQLRFRKDYNNLIWDEHLLRKPSSMKTNG